MRKADYIPSRTRSPAGCRMGWPGGKAGSHGRGAAKQKRGAAGTSARRAPSSNRKVPPRERIYFGVSVVRPPPEVLAFSAALRFLVASALSIQVLATLIWSAYSSLLSVRSARSRIKRFSYAMASS